MSNMFPNAYSEIYRNEEGEVLGWSDTSYDEPEYCDMCGTNHSAASACADQYDEDDEEEEENDEESWPDGWDAS